MTHGRFPCSRGRRLRTSGAIREMVAEHNLKPADCIAPVVVMEGEGEKAEIPSMPDYYRYTLDLLLKEVQELYEVGIRAVNLYAKVPDEKKDNQGTEALNPEGLMQRTIKHIKQEFAEIVVMPDIELDHYYSNVNDGIVEDGEILNDESVDLLARVAVSHAEV